MVCDGAIVIAQQVVEVQDAVHETELRRDGDREFVAHECTVREGAAYLPASCTEGVGRYLNNFWVPAQLAPERITMTSAPVHRQFIILPSTKSQNDLLHFHHR